MLFAIESDSDAPFVEFAVQPLVMRVQKWRCLTQLVFQYVRTVGDDGSDG